MKHPLVIYLGSLIVTQQGMFSPDFGILAYFGHTGTHDGLSEMVREKMLDTPASPPLKKASDG